jgi:hypothetical protein
VSSAAPEGGGIVYGRSHGLTRDHDLYQLSQAIQRAHSIYKFSDTVEGGAVFACLASVYGGSIFSQSVPTEDVSIFKIAQFNPGVIPHLPGITSELFEYDVVASYKTYNKLTIHMLEVLSAAIKQSGDIDFDRNLIQTDYYTTIAGEVDICKGDEAPPIITYISPVASGTVLRPVNQDIEFRLSDTPGGVSLSSLKVYLTSTTSGTLQLLNAGVDQTGGKMSVTGDPSSYLIRYTPGFNWQYNDRVVVTISGSDRPPTIAGNPFYCGSAGVNYFTGDITFKVHTPSDMGASLTVVGDVSPPYIASASPASGTVGNSVFAPVVIVLADDLTGIRLSTLTVVVEDTVIINEGVGIEGVSITGSPTSYTITYTPEDSFEYGSTVDVSVYAEDRATSPNIFSTSYSFSCIGDGGLRIENFLPAVGTTLNPSTFDIEVDLFDDTYGIDEDQSFLVINGQIVDATLTPVTSGIHFNYHPPNDFAYDRPIVVKVHGVNQDLVAPIVKEQAYTLYYGQRILVHHGGDKFKHDETIEVFVHARSIERMHKDLSTGYLFTSYTQPQSNIGAYIEAITPYVDLPSSIQAQGPVHRYGQTVTVSFYVEDYEGHALGPYVYTYTIEEES